jgi:NodT family efflux transporter outer membrane factor (OMF) lipoprotein
VAQAVESGAFKTGEWPRQAWWEDFKDPVLNHLIESALALSPTLQRAEENLRASHWFAQQKRAALFPEVDFDANTNWQHLGKYGFFRSVAPTIPPEVNDVTIGFSYFYEFDIWGKNRDLFRAALGEESAMAAEKMQAELILTTAIAYTYAELQLLLRKKHIYQQMEAYTQRIENIRFERVLNGLDTSPTQLDSHFDTLDIQAAITSIDQQIQQDVHQLKALSGLGQDEDLEVRYHPWTPIAAALPENLSLDLIARRPDLIAQRARVEAAAYEIGAAKTDFYPNISFRGILGFESVLGRILNSFSGNIQPAIHLPIFTARRLQAQLKEKVADFNKAVYAYNELILKTGQEVADRLSDITLLQKQIEIRRQSFETSVAVADLTLRRVEHAIDNQLSLLDAKNGALESELTLADVEYGQQLASILLIRALGGGYHE